MKNNRNGSSLLRLLAISTAMALLGIVVLQAYWLRTSYIEQQSRFQADVENARVVTLIKDQFSNAMDNPNMKVAKELMPALPDLVAKMVSSIPQSIRQDSIHPKQTITLNVSGDSWEKLGFDSSKAADIRRYIADHPELNDSTPIALNLNSGSKHQSPGARLESLKKTFDAELLKRAIKIPSALAILDSSGKILAATCDTQAFKIIPVKSALSDASLSNDGTQLQAAFPDANLYLLRRMSWLLMVTALLILLCSASFALLLRLFFRQKRLSDIRNDFMNNMTHELKTPIASVSVALELIQDQRHPVSEEKKTEYLGIAQGELQRLSMLVEKVLKMAYFERGDIKISPEPILAAAWLKNIVGSMRPVFEVAGAKVSTKVQPELMMIYADKTHLTNVIQNLLENALKYNGNDEPRIQVDIYEEESSTVLSVTDNGRGIHTNYLDKVFDKFFRVPTGDRHDTKGYGLGLSYVKAIAELHGGTVAVSSVPGEHTTFTVKLPKQSL